MAQLAARAALSRSTFFDRFTRELDLFAQTNRIDSSAWIRSPICRRGKRALSAWGPSASSSVSRCRRPMPRASSRTSARSLDDVPLLWLAGPITGLFVQPLVGYYSDRTWTRFGRRRPYFLVGAALAACTLVGHAECHHVVDGGAHVVAAGRLAQSHHGSVPGAVADQMSAGAALHRLRHVHGPREPGRGRRQPAALGLHAAGRVVAAPAGRNQRRGEICVLPGGGDCCWCGGVLVRVNYPRISRREMLEKFDGAARQPHRAFAARGCAAMPSSGSALGSLGLLGARLASVRAALYVLVVRLAGLWNRCCCWPAA